MPHLIGLTGAKRSGKDTLAAFLTEEHGYARLAFADALRSTLYDLNPYVGPWHDPRGIVWDNLRLRSVVDSYGWDVAKALPEVRRLMQAHGVAIREHAGESVWLDVVATKARALLAAGTSVVVTDVRFDNELDLITGDPNGEHVHIERPGLEEDSTSAHVSEDLARRAAALADYVVHNDGSLEALRLIAADVAIPSPL